MLDDDDSLVECGAGATVELNAWFEWFEDEELAVEAISLSSSIVFKISLSCLFKVSNFPLSLFIILTSKKKQSTCVEKNEKTTRFNDLKSLWSASLTILNDVLHLLSA